MDNPKTIRIGSDFGFVMYEPNLTDPATGICYDFNCGLRIKLPEGLWDVTITDASTGVVFVSDKMSGGSIYTFPYKYYVKMRVVAVNKLDNKTFEHTLNLNGMEVAFKMMQRTLGDPLYMLPAIVEFQRIHQCRAVVYASPRIAEIVSKQHPEIEFRNLENETPNTPYATYYIGLFFDQNFFWQPYDFRTYSLIQQAQHILGLDDTKTLPPPKVALSKKYTILSGGKRFVAISYSGSKQCKFWNNPTGWYETVKWLNGIGYTVLCIDKDPVYGLAPMINVMPPGVVDMTGDFTLQQRIDVLKQCDFFIGTPSGLAALAWCCKIPVVMISGFSLPFAEFPCYRVINQMSECKGCWNDTRINFNHHAMHWCPRIDEKVDVLNQLIASVRAEEVTEDSKSRLQTHTDSLKLLDVQRFMCTKTITSSMVIAKINELLRDLAKIRIAKSN